MPRCGLGLTPDHTQDNHALEHSSPSALPNRNPNTSASFRVGQQTPLFGGKALPPPITNISLTNIMVLQQASPQPKLGAYCQSIKGSVTQDNDLIERNKGGYYFNFSTFGTYKKESVTFDLTSAAFKRKDSLANIYSNNWLIVGFKQTSGHTHEAGVRFLGNGSTYYLEPYYTYYVSGDPHAKYTVGSPIATGTVNNGVAKFNCRIKVTLAVSANGKFIPTVANLTTGTSAFGTEVSDSSVNTGASFRWFPAVTAVPEKGEISAILCDERNLSYMTGVKLKDSLLYTTASSTSGVSYTPSSSLSQYAFFYNK